MMTKRIRTYTDLIKLPTFQERFEYLKLNGQVGVSTFGFDRIFNQRFYTSKEWRDFRRTIILRDNGCDLGVPDYEIRGKRVVIHHLNPITLEDFEKNPEILLDPENAITTTHLTHNAIHYGDDNLLPTPPIERKPNDTCPWKR